MHLLWLDTDVEDYFDSAARTCTATDYSLDELEEIYWHEVYPTMRSNLWSVAGEWAPFSEDGLADLILKTYKPRRRVLFRKFRTYAFQTWARLRDHINQLRSA